MEIKSCIFLFLNENKMVGYTHIWHKDSFIYGKSNKQTTYKQKKKKRRQADAQTPGKMCSEQSSSGELKRKDYEHKYFFNFK